MGFFDPTSAEVLDVGNIITIFSSFGGLVGSTTVEKLISLAMTNWKLGSFAGIGILGGLGLVTVALKACLADEHLEAFGWGTGTAIRSTKQMLGRDTAANGLVNFGRQSRRQQLRLTNLIVDRHNESLRTLNTDGAQKVCNNDWQEAVKIVTDDDTLNTMFHCNMLWLGRSSAVTCKDIRGFHIRLLLTAFAVSLLSFVLSFVCIMIDILFITQKATFPTNVAMPYWLCKGVAITCLNSKFVLRAWFTSPQRSSSGKHTEMRMIGIDRRCCTCSGGVLKIYKQRDGDAFTSVNHNLYVCDTVYKCVQGLANPIYQKERRKGDHQYWSRTSTWRAVDLILSYLLVIAVGLFVGTYSIYTAWLSQHKTSSTKLVIVWGLFEISLVGFKMFLLAKWSQWEPSLPGSPIKLLVRSVDRNSQFVLSDSRLLLGVIDSYDDITGFAIRTAPMMYQRDHWLGTGYLRLNSTGKLSLPPIFVAGKPFTATPITLFYVLEHRIGRLELIDGKELAFAVSIPDDVNGEWHIGLQPRQDLVLTDHVSATDFVGAKTRRMYLKRDHRRWPTSNDAGFQHLELSTAPRDTDLYNQELLWFKLRNGNEGNEERTEDLELYARKKSGRVAENQIQIIPFSSAMREMISRDLEE